MDVCVSNSGQLNLNSLTNSSAGFSVGNSSSTVKKWVYLALFKVRVN